MNNFSANVEKIFETKSRKRIEALFSQLCDQFMIRRSYAKTFEGVKIFSDL